MVQDSHEFAQAVETMMKQTLGIPLDEKVSTYYLSRAFSVRVFAQGYDADARRDATRRSYCPRAEVSRTY